MATTINADTIIGGAIVTGDTSGILSLQAAGTTLLTLESGVVSAAGGFTADSASITGALSAGGDITFSATTAAKLPSGTTAERPGSASNGMIRYNSDDGSFEGYAGGEWGAIGGGGDVQTATTTSITETSIATYALADALGLEATVLATDTVDTERTITKLLVTHDGVTAVATQYGEVNTATAMATFDVDVSGGNVRILATAASTNSTNYTVNATLIA